ncbi:MAG: cell surface protein SprA [Flavobacteriaceae bacterium]
MKQFYKSLLVVFLFTTTFIQAQDGNPVATDSIAPLPYTLNPERQGGLFLNTTDTEVIYDAETGKYIFLEKIGDFYVKRPIYMTADEYKEYRLQRDMIDYYKSKTSALDGLKKDSDAAKKDLLPKYYVNSKFFESIFGSNEVEINVQGNVLVKMGVLYQKQENPRLSERQRKSTSFDFDQQISASINAKIGTRLGVNINWDSQSTFDFQNLIKLDYTPTEDDILQKIEMGNVSMPLQSSLIKGAQNLFAFKTKLKFGATDVTLVAGKQQSQTRSVSAQGGASVFEFELRASDYDKDRHFFLAQYFRNNYDRALENFPLINSGIDITRVEIWVTNRTTQTENVRNIVAIADLAEEDQNFVTNPSITFTGQQLPTNDSNSLNNLINTATGDIRSFTTLSSAFNSFGLSNFNQGSDYSVLENARKLTLGSDFTLHPQLGYISLNRSLAESEVLAVAYEYTQNGQVYTVGELSDNGIVAPANLVVKLLRPEIISTTTHMWDLMMKNVYDLRSYQMSQEGFRLEVLYQDNATGVELNTLQNAQTSGVNNNPLLNLLNIDRLDAANNIEPSGDGFFDYIEGITVNSQKGLIYFPIVEPFGDFLDDKLDTTDDLYVFNELYDRTQSDAQNNYQSKDKYVIKGYYKSERQNGIPLGAFNVPRGSVVVTTGGRNLVEGVDFVVDYEIGNVQIINPSLISSNAPIEVSVESNNAFSTQNRTFIGVDVQHTFSDNFAIGATYLKLNEKPFTQKAQFGAEPVNNSVLGFNLNYSTEVPKLTKWTNYLPNIDTDATSNFSLRAEAAYLLPNSPKGIELNGEAASYLDDFEGTQIPLNIDSPTNWKMASMPQEKVGNQSSPFMYADNAEPSNYKYGNRRARLAWYNIDRLFYGSSLRPDSVDDNELSRAETRRVTYDELFPDQDLDITQSNAIRTLDLAYYPKERGSYNFNTDVDTQGNFVTPEDNWGGIMRALTTTDFQQANVEYIQFWLMDPFENYSMTEQEGAPAIVNPADFEGELYFNLGNISEDVLHDDRKMFENGLPADGNQIETLGPTQNVDAQGGYSSIPLTQALLNAFTENDGERPNQDLGFDGISDSKELDRFSAFATHPNVAGLNSVQNDPGSDNYEFYRSTNLDNSNASILTRYKNYNRTQGNSPTLNNSPENYPTSATQFPDTEDLNKDQTMSTAEAYFQYKININNSGGFTVGTNNIIDSKTTVRTLENGSEQTTTWYQYRIPIQAVDFNDPHQAVGGISSFNSIRFMRLFVTKFKVPVVLRFGNLELVRGNWRRYTKVLKEPIPTPINPDLTLLENQNFEVGVVNLFENSNPVPGEIPYVMPPGVTQERLRGTTSVQRQNEQSISIKVNKLKPGETRAVFKNLVYDIRMFKKLKIFVHCEKVTGGSDLQDGEVAAIIRLGSDVIDNYYQVEVPLNVTELGATTPEEIWKNDIETALEDFGKLRIERFRNGALPGVLYPIDDPLIQGYKLFVKGNPSLSKVKTIMLGVKNVSTVSQDVELWFNELRVVDFDNEGGWAAVANANVNLADFADFAASGRASSKGFGSIDQRVGERSQDNIKQYDLVSNINLGQLLPKKLGLKLPLNISLSEEFKEPKYDPQYQDVLFDQTTIADSPNRNNATDYTKRRSISLINVRKEKTNLKKKKRVYDIENLAVSMAYNDMYHKDYNVQKYLDQNVRAGASYTYSFESKNIEPLKNIKFLKSKHLRLLKDFNFNPLPNTISVNTNVIRAYNQQLSRPLIANFLPDLPVLERRQYAFDWDYSVGYDLTKALQFNFRAANSYINDDFEEDANNNVINGRIFDKFFNIGRANHYQQKLDVNYKVPFNKIPLLDFITGTYRYTADFDWQSISKQQADLVGNTIQNANTHVFNADLNMKTFYNKIGVNKLFVKKRRSIKKKFKKKKSSKKDKKSKAEEPSKKGDKEKEENSKASKTNLKEEIENAKKNKSKSEGEISSKNKINRNKKTSGRKVNRKKLPFGKKVVLGVVDVITSVKKVRISYTENNGTFLPGYRHNVGFMGRDTYTGGIAPTLGFVFGEQNNSILNTALDNDWLITRGGTDLTLFPYYNKTFDKKHYNKLDLNLDVKPFKNLNIDVTANRTFTKNLTQQIDIIDDGLATPYLVDSPINEIGNFAISHFMLGTSFADSDELFTNFISNRDIIANRLATEAGQSNTTGFGSTNQSVLFPAFIATYSGENLNKTKLGDKGVFRKIPLPNWRVTYKGLSKLKWIKKRFRTVTLTHNYQSAYSILGFNSNLQYNTSQFDIADNYRNKTLFNGVNLIEAFSPLIKVDVKMKNSFSFRGEIKKDRSYNMNFSNSSITEITGKEYVIGLGYKFKNVKWKFKTRGGKMSFKGDINLKADFGIRDNITHIRSYETLTDQITGGQRIMTIKFLADYSLNKNLMASLFYDQNSSRFKISTTFPRNSVNTGISLRYNFGN